MIDGSLGMHIILWLLLTAAVGRGCSIYSYHRGFRACEKQMRKDLQIGDEEFSKKYQHLDKYLN